MADPLDRPLVIGNCSGFYGDRLSAMREMVEGGPLDVLTGDYLAELTMLILGRDQLKDPALGYARTFARQLEECLGLALERGVRIVSNAGGLNPSGLAARVVEMAAAQGLAPNVAYVDGDDVRSVGFSGALTANAYLGGFGITAALRDGADVVVTGRVTDASLVVGPAAWWHGWSPAAYDELAGAVVAGHVLECGCQATGGNFSGFGSVVPTTSQNENPAQPLGFPLAEIASDGSSVITKHPHTGGLVSIDTVTAQLMYEIQTAQYLNPDVTVDLTSIRLEQVGADRVRISDVRGAAPPERLKVSVNTLGGHRNQVEFVLTGLDIDAKAAWVHEQLEARLEPRRPEIVDWHLDRLPLPDAETEEAASCLLRVTVKDPSPDVVGRAFSSAAVELALASYPGFTMTSPPGSASPYGVYRPAYVDRAEVEQVAVMPDGERIVISDAVGAADPRVVEPVETSARSTVSPVVEPVETSAATRRVPLGTFVHARSGDKGGDANVGLWVGQGDRRDERIAWLLDLVTPDLVRSLLPEAKDLDVEVFVLPNLGGVNVLVHGLLGEGVAASTRFDPQAKAVGEWLRSRLVDVPEDLL